MQENEKDIVKWYVVGTLGVHQEMKIRDNLRQKGMECYVPMRYEMKQVGGTRQRKLVPAITGLVFAHTSYNEFRNYAETTRETLFLRKSTYSNREEYLTVPAQDMERFIALTEQFIEQVDYFTPNEITVHEGELVRIMLGSKAYEAEVKRVKGKRGKQLVVEIADVTTAVITLTPELMQTITKLTDSRRETERQKKEEQRQKKLAESGRTDQRRSRNLALDKKALFDTAFRLLFKVTKAHEEDAENRMALMELRRIRERLTGMKGVIPTLEGELALAIYLADTKIGTGTEESEERLRQAIGKLKESSILRMRMRYFLAKLTGDEQERLAILKEAKGWNKLRLSAKQAAFIEELKATEP